MVRFLGILVTAAVVLGAPAAGAAPGDGERRASAGGAVSLTGNGYGHGHGLSQYGANARAAAGLSYRQILSFYYPKLKQGVQGGKVSVLITADTSTDVQVRARSGLTVTSLGNDRTYALKKRQARWWRITPVTSGKRSAIAFQGKGFKGWRTVRTVPGEAQFSAGRKPITLRTPTGNRAYRGVLRSASPAAASKKRDTVNVVSLEDYLRGVVPREVPALWPQQAVRAQAVAARTYASFERLTPLASHYEICDTSLCQVYGGYTDEHPASDQAIRATRKEILTTKGKPAFTQFSASNGGYTSAGPFAYLPAKKDPYDKAYRGWTASITDAAVRTALPQVGALTSIEVLERDGKGAFGGRVTRIKVVGSNGSSVLSGDSFRSIFGLRSTMFRVD